MTINNDGDVGIGTTSPYSKLEITAGADTSHIRISEGSHNNSSSTFLYPALTYYARQDNARRGRINPFNQRYGASASISFTDRPGTYTYVNAVRTSDIVFHTATSYVSPNLGHYPIERMRITAEGNVGIGTTSPSSKLEITAGADKSHIRIGDGSHNGSSSSFLYPALTYYARQDNIRRNTDPYTEGSGSNGGASASISFADRPGTYSWPQYTRGSDIVFHTARTVNDANSLLGYYPRERMRITAEGNVGIGVSNPTGSLHINSPNTFNFRMSQVGSSSWPGLQANFGAGGQHYDVYNTTTVKHFGSTGNGEYMYLNYYSGGGVRLASGTNVTSDNRLKHNEEIIENGIEIIKKIKPKKYFKSQKLYDEDYQYSLDSSGNPITDDDYIIETGLIAQEIMNIPSLKYLVEEIPDKKKIIKQDKKDNSGNYIFDASGNKITEDVEVLSLKSRYTVRYNDLFVYNIAATQELDKKVIALENENAELKSELAAIKQHLGI